MNLRGLMKKETSRRLRIIEELYYAKDYIASKDLRAMMKCSLPILLNDIGFLNGENLPFQIKKSDGLYSIEFEEHATLDVVYSYMLRRNLEFEIFESLFFEEHTGIQPAAKELNCSFSNMQRYLIAIRERVVKWGISVLNRPLHIEGDELVIRGFYYKFFKEARVPFTNYKFSRRLVSAVDQLIRQILTENNVTNNMNIHFQLMHSFLIALRRLDNGYTLEGLPVDSGLLIPTIEQLPRLVRFIRQESTIDFTEKELRECLWPLFSHQLILNHSQQSIAHKKNKQLASFYETHHFLLESINDLLASPLSQAEMVEMMRLLGNELFCYFPDKRSMEILQEPNRMLLNLVDKKYSRELSKLRRVVSDFLIPQRKEAFIPIYICCLITIVDNIFQRLAELDKPIKVLLLSDASTSHERFWQSILPAHINGAVNYDYFETPFILQEQLTKLTKAYDLIVTNVTMTDLESACPLIAINAYPTAKDIKRIQEFINEFDPLPSRKELYNELTPST
ncbi:helix-turn-helix domain-containing protein [Enterococcus sp. AZ196]|uniref:helix-turn-helix domain-containing protein n=1 Tax=Enterococcus sp. AZ196 TaxID=2774659 RepID=UPI003D265D12